MKLLTFAMIAVFAFASAVNAEPMKITMDITGVVNNDAGVDTGGIQSFGTITFMDDGTGGVDVWVETTFGTKIQAVYLKAVDGLGELKLSPDGEVNFDGLPGNKSLGEQFDLGWTLQGQDANTTMFHAKITNGDGDLNANNFVTQDGGTIYAAVKIAGIGGNDGDSMWVGVVPEPASVILLGGGLVALAGASRRRRKRMA